MDQVPFHDPNLSPLSLVFHPLFWGLERRDHTHSYAPSESLGYVYWIGLDMGGRIGWTEALSLREMCEKAAARADIQLPCPVPDRELLCDLRLIAQDAAFKRLQPVPYPDGTPVEEMDRHGRRFSLWMDGLWWSDWRLYGNIPFDLAGLIRRGAEEIRNPHLEEYAPWQRLDALLVPILGPEHRYWYVRWGRSYGVHVVYKHLGETCSLHLGDPLEVSKMNPGEIRAKLPRELLECLEQTRQVKDGEHEQMKPDLGKESGEEHTDGSGY